MTADPGQASGRALTIEELARQAETTPEYVERLVEAGAIHANPDGSHEVENLPRIRLALALAAGGIDFDDLMAVIRSGALQLDWVARLWTVARPSGRSFADFADSLGDRAP